MKLHDITPKRYQCASAVCPAVYTRENDGKLIIIGKKVNAQEVGLADKVGGG